MGKWARGWGTRAGRGLDGKALAPGHTQPQQGQQGLCQWPPSTRDTRDYSGHWVPDSKQLKCGRTMQRGRGNAVSEARCGARHGVDVVLRETRQSAEPGKEEQLGGICVYIPTAERTGRDISSHQVCKC